MRLFTTTMTALTVLAAMAATAQAEVNYGPIKQGNKCFHASPMSGDHRANGFGYWGDCPQTASASVATTPRVTRRHSTVSR
jgi:hypothetical protein